MNGRVLIIINWWGRKQSVGCLSLPNLSGVVIWSGQVNKQRSNVGLKCPNRYFKVLALFRKQTPLE